MTIAMAFVRYSIKDNVLLFKPGKVQVFVKTRGGVVRQGGEVHKLIDNYLTNNKVPFSTFSVSPANW